jgi:predicted O-methyltransferase YrrM
MTSRVHFLQVPLLPASQTSRWNRLWKHPFFAWAGFRSPLAQHTEAEHIALMRYVGNFTTVVEIGVAEGASAAGLREAMPPEGTLYLVDPFHLSRLASLNFLKRAAHRAVRSAGSARPVWIEAFSYDAVRDWNLRIDFLLIDGDHREEGVERDWKDWSPFVAPDGVVAFHDARQFPSGWPSPEYGPVRFVDRFFRNGSPAPWRIIEEVDSLVFVSRRKPI